MECFRSAKQIPSSSFFFATFSYIFYGFHSSCHEMTSFSVSVWPWLARNRLHCFMRRHRHKKSTKPNRIEMNNCWKEITIISQMKTQLHGIIQLAECKAKRMNSTWRCHLGACWRLDSRQFFGLFTEEFIHSGHKCKPSRNGIHYCIRNKAETQTRAHSAHTKRRMRRNSIQIVLSHAEMHFIILQRENGKKNKKRWKNTANVLTSLSVRTHRSISRPPANRVKKHTHRLIALSLSPVYC